jgi:hypothetical protein
VNSTGARRWFALFTALVAFQMIPLLLSPTRSLDGHLRNLGLNMYDDLVSCVSSFQIQSEGLHVEYALDRNKYSIRLGCDPHLIKAKADQICRTLNTTESKLKVVLWSKNSYSTTAIEVLNEPNYCHSAGGYIPESSHHEISQ